MSAPQPPYGSPSPPPLNPPPPTAPPDCGAPESPGRNGFAIASLICGIVAPCGAGLLSVIFGIIALVQIGKSRQRGKGMAITGLVLTGAWIVVLAVVGVVAFLSNVPARDDTGEVVRDGSMAFADLAPGDCIEEIGEGVSFTVPVVPCAEPHEGEVYAVFDLADGDWPGEEAVFVEAETSCVDELAAYSQVAYDDPDVEVFYYHPTRASWRTGDREVICVAYFLDGVRTGSVTE